MSTCGDYAANPYTLKDFANDAAAVMDAYGLASAHIAGASMGGMILQSLMIDHRPRVRSAVIIMSTPLAGGATEKGMASEDLPGPDSAWMEKMMLMAANLPTTREELIAQKVEQYGMLSGTAQPYDAETMRQVAEIEVDQAVDLTAAMNHLLAINASEPSDRRPLLEKVMVPTLIIHGTEDPILPYEHGTSLAATIPEAELMTLDHAGHEIPACYEDEVVARMIALQNKA